MVVELALAHARGSYLLSARQAPARVGLLVKVAHNRMQVWLGSLSRRRVGIGMGCRPTTRVDGCGDQENVGHLMGLLDGEEWHQCCSA